MMPSLPPLQLSSSKSSESGGIGAPNTVYFGGFGTGAGGGDMAGAVAQYWPYLLGGALLLIALRKH
jgi:hypothetical protein